MISSAVYRGHKASNQTNKKDVQEQEIERDFKLRIKETVGLHNQRSENRALISFVVTAQLICVNILFLYEHRSQNESNLQ